MCYNFFRCIMKVNKRVLIIILGCVIALAISSLLNFTYYEEYKLFYSSEDFGITVIKSDVDANNNGIDDYTDILEGARIDAYNHPVYDGRYWNLGYPPDNIGVCTDVIWRAFKHAGYNLRAMLDNDIEKYNKEYNGIKIKNETSYELTDEILNPNNLDIRKDNVTIFHTHTCESYTQSENYKYTPSRKLQNNRFKLFSCKGRG